MKKYLFILALLMLCSCQDNDEPAPVAPDIFEGLWKYENKGLNLSISFHAKKNTAAEDQYTFSDVAIKYEGVEISTGSDVGVYDQFADKDGFGKIQISGSWTTQCSNGLTCDKWIIISLIYNTIYKDGEKMNAHEMRISVINKDEITLADQLFIKTE